MTSQKLFVKLETRNGASLYKMTPREVQRSNFEIVTGKMIERLQNIFDS